MTNAIHAITARIQGVYDDPSLLAFGPLSTNILDDVLAIAQAATSPAADPSNPSKTIAPKVVPTCPRCGSEDLTRDAAAHWNIVTQQWELATVYDTMTCEQCGKETKTPEWIDDKKATD